MELYRALLVLTMHHPHTPIEIFQLCVLVAEILVMLFVVFMISHPLPIGPHKKHPIGWLGARCWDCRKIKLRWTGKVYSGELDIPLAVDLNNLGQYAARIDAKRSYSYLFNTDLWRCSRCYPIHEFQKAVLDEA